MTDRVSKAKAAKLRRRRSTSEQVFISYSWDDEHHIHRVLELSNRLRSDGIDCVLDQYEVSPLEGWPRWMERKIEESQFVLVICTEKSHRKVMGQEDEGGLGVKWEGNLIYQHLYNAGANNSKFIPVLFDPKDARYIPTPLQGATRFRVDTQAGYDALYRRLLNQPAAPKPKLGARRSLPERAVRTDFSAYLSMPIDMPLWDKAKWKAVFYLFPVRDDEPPILGLGFRDKIASEQIFEGWHRRYGDDDRFDELRISIIEGDIPGKPPGYSVHVGPDYKNTIKRYQAAGLNVNPDVDLFISVSRIHRMNPTPESKNLEMFKAAYRRWKKYLLIPGVIRQDGSVLECCKQLGILKHEISFRRVGDIDENDEDSVVLSRG